MEDETIILVTNDTVIYFDYEKEEVIFLVGDDEKRMVNCRELIVNDLVCLFFGDFIVEVKLMENERNLIFGLVESFLRIVPKCDVTTDALH